MNKTILLSLGVVLAACDGTSEQQPAANNAAAPETNAVAQAPVPSLEGEWVVEQTNGKTPDQVWPMTADVTKDRFTIHSECRTMTWTFTQNRNLVQFTPVPGGECSRVRSPAEDIANATVKLANIAMFSDEGRTVQISGPGGTISMSRR